MHGTELNRNYDWHMWEDYNGYEYWSVNFIENGEIVCENVRYTDWDSMQHDGNKWLNGMSLQELDVSSY